MSASNQQNAKNLLRQEKEEARETAWWETLPTEVTIYQGFVYDAETNVRLGTLAEPDLDAGLGLSDRVRGGGIYEEMQEFDDQLEEAEMPLELEREIMRWENSTNALEEEHWARDQHVMFDSDPRNISPRSAPAEPAPHRPFPLPVPTHEYPDYCATVEEETAHIKHYYNHNPPAHIDSIKHFLWHGGAGFNHQVRGMRVLSHNPEQFQLCYDCYAELCAADAVCNKDRCKEIGGRLAHNIDLMQSTYYMFCWSMGGRCAENALSPVIKGYSTCIEFYWDGIGNWRC